MFYSCRVPIPKGTNINFQRCNGGKDTYVCITYQRVYNPDRKYAEDKRTTIGKPCDDDPTMMYPNPRYFEFFPENDLPNGGKEPVRSRTLSVGTFLVMRKISEEYKLGDMLFKVMGEDSLLFLDLAMYCIVTEQNVAQHYPAYTYDHPLMTEGMHRYEDSSVSELMQRITEDQKDEFLKLWNGMFNRNGMVYMSYDSTNKYCAGDFEIADLSSRPKQGLDRPVINYAMAYDQNNSIPLFYDEYSGSIVDVSHLRYMLGIAKGFGYSDATFIIDRGYYSQENFTFMDENGYDFIAMAKGRNKFITGKVKEIKGKFERVYETFIPKFDVHGCTVKGPLFYADIAEAKTRYIHVYYSGTLEIMQEAEITRKIERQKKELDKRIAKGVTDAGDGYDHYFWLTYEDNLTDLSRPEGPRARGDKPGKLVCYETRDRVINEELGMCGYFVIVTSKEMKARDAIAIYKNRDTLEKMFRADKSFLGYHAMRVHSEEALTTKTFVEFIALIIRCRMYSCLKTRNEEFDSPKNYMSVPAAIAQLEQIEMTRGADGIYRLDNEPTKKQKDILSAFGVDAAWVKREVAKLAKVLQDEDRKV